MPLNPLFDALSSQRIAALIQTAKRRVVYAAPGIQDAPATALTEIFWLRTTFDLLEKSSTLSSKSLEADLNEIRKNLTRSLGKNHGRVVLKSAKPRLEERLKELAEKLSDHQKKVKDELQGKLNKSRKQVVEYYLPLAEANPPDAVVGETLSPANSKEVIRAWLDHRLRSAFPTAEKLIGDMTLEYHFKDVTFETLNRPDFLGSVKMAFPRVDWDKAYEEFRAAGEESTTRDDEEKT